MVRLAHERIADLFALAEREASGGNDGLAHRYVTLARRIGTRYNVRVLPEYRELYCRRCSTYWTEGRTVRTRLRSGRRVRTCLACARRQRTVYQPRRRSESPPEGGPSDERVSQAALTAPVEPTTPAKEDGDEREEA